MNNKFYITTTLPYVNAKPHLGFALEIIQADIIARYHILMGDEVVFNTGTDEHGVKIYRKAQEEGKGSQAYVDEYAAKFDDLKDALNLSYTNFIRTSDEAHMKAAQEFWKICDKNGDIYKKAYKIKYCVGCELEKTDSELEDGRCSIHPTSEIELIEEENYFFRWSKYQDALLKFYEENPDFVIPEFRFNEIKNFVKKGLQDFSISRLKEKMPWGVPVPGDETQVMYVWFDALINYISTLGWPGDIKKFEGFWGTEDSRKAVQVAGKDNLRQQSAMWQGMLLSAGLPLSKHVIIHGFITSEGQKMSKSVGNVIDPLEVVEKFGTDALRYWVAKEANTFEDSDFTWDKFKDSYNADLANGLGNLASRILKMAETNLDGPIEIPPETIPTSFKDAMDEFDIKRAAGMIWDDVRRLDHYIQEKQPFVLIKTNPKDAKEIIQELVINLYAIAEMLNPILPGTSETIKELVKENKSPEKPLFPRID